MRTTSRGKGRPSISAAEFDRRFERGDDMLRYLDFDKAVVVKRVNVDFPAWMIDLLDREALKLNVSRQAVIKMWIYDRLKAPERSAARRRGPAKNPLD